MIEALPIIGGVLTVALVVVIILYVRVRHMPVEDGHDASAASDEDLKDGPEYLPRIGDMRVRVSALQHIGARERQEDAFGLSPADAVDDYGLCVIVCDGMGGMRNGAEAAELATRSAMLSYLSGVLPPEQALCLAAETANRDVYNLACSMELEGAMGTTMIIALVRPEGLYFLSIGDSRLFLLKGGELRQLNTDHVFFADLLKRVNDGLMTMAEANSHPEREYLTSYVGLKEIARADLGGPIKLEAGDRVLVCTDGLYKALANEKILDILTRHPTKTHEKLLDAVRSAHFAKQDNITIVLMDCLSPEVQA